MNRKCNIMLMIMFLMGSMIFLLSVLNQLKEVEADDYRYAALSMQLKPDDTAAPTGLVSLEKTVAEMANDLSGKEAAVQTVLPVLPKVQRTAEPAITCIPGTAPTPVHSLNVPNESISVSNSDPATERVDLQACLTQNKDFIAWITIPGTPVDYPVVRSDKTDYYLNHLFTGEKSKLGCLFSLADADYQTPSRNIAIYGHHLSHSDAMFSSLIRYKNSEYYASHPIIELQTIYGNRSYRIFAVVNMKVSDWDAATARFSSNKAFQNYIKRARSQALYTTEVSVDSEDCILTLITCDRSYGGVSGRLLVMAVEE